MTVALENSGTGNEAWRGGTDCWNLKGGQGLERWDTGKCACLPWGQHRLNSEFNSYHHMVLRPLSTSRCVTAPNKRKSLSIRGFEDQVGRSQWCYKTPSLPLQSDPTCIIFSPCSCHLAGFNFLGRWDSCFMRLPCACWTVTMSELYPL